MRTIPVEVPMAIKDGLDIFYQSLVIGNTQLLDRWFDPALRARLAQEVTSVRRDARWHGFSLVDYQASFTILRSVIAGIAVWAEIWEDSWLELGRGPTLRRRIPIRGTYFLFLRFKNGIWTIIHDPERASLAGLLRDLVAA